VKANLISWVLGCFLLVAAWSVGSVLAGRETIPPPSIVLEHLWSARSIHLVNGGWTTLESLGGLVVASTAAAVIVIAVGLFPKSEPIFWPYLTMLKASPAVAFIPLFMKFAGIGFLCKVTVSAMISFFPLVVDGIAGLHKTQDTYRLVLMAYGPSRWQMLRNVSGAYALSGFLEGMKTAAPLSVVGAIVGEYLTGGDPGGIGQYIMNNNRPGCIPALFAGVTIATSIGFLFFGCAYVFSWYAEKSLDLSK
jgi:NitT/TauT family transport system permease protein